MDDVINSNNSMMIESSPLTQLVNVCNNFNQQFNIVEQNKRKKTLANILDEGGIENMHSITMSSSVYSIGGDLNQSPPKKVCVQSRNILTAANNSSNSRFRLKDKSTSGGTNKITSTIQHHTNYHNNNNNNNNNNPNNIKNQGNDKATAKERFGIGFTTEAFGNNDKSHKMKNLKPTNDMFDTSMFNGVDMGEFWKRFQMTSTFNYWAPVMFLNHSNNGLSFSQQHILNHNNSNSKDLSSNKCPCVFCNQNLELDKFIPSYNVAPPFSSTICDNKILDMNFMNNYNFMSPNYPSPAAPPHQANSFQMFYQQMFQNHLLTQYWILFGLFNSPNNSQNIKEANFMNPLSFNNNNNVINNILASQTSSQGIICSNDKKVSPESISPLKPIKLVDDTNHAKRSYCKISNFSPQHHNFSFLSKNYKYSNNSQNLSGKGISNYSLKKRNKSSPIYCQSNMMQTEYPDRSTQNIETAHFNLYNRRNIETPKLTNGLNPQNNRTNFNMSKDNKNFSNNISSHSTQNLKDNHPISFPLFPPSKQNNLADPNINHRMFLEAAYKTYFLNTLCGTSGQTYENIANPLVNSTNLSFSMPNKDLNFLHPPLDKFFPFITNGSGEFNFPHQQSI